MNEPVSQDIAAAFGKYFSGGSGPTHANLTNAFLAAGLGDVAPNAGGNMSDGPNKQTRVQNTVMAAVRRPASARALVEYLLSALRTHGVFDSKHPNYDPTKNRILTRAFASKGWTLSDDGELTTTGSIDLNTGGRDALDEQLVRLRHNSHDPGALLGSAKDLLEATAKFILEELGMPYNAKSSFDELWYHARYQLGLLPENVAGDVPGANSIKAILQSQWTIARQVNVLRGMQGAGHGRTLPTGVTAEQALLVVREACSVAEFALANLDRQLGRGAAA